MLLQTNSYIVPRDKRVEHARLLRRFRQTLLRLGCDHFEVYEQTGANWSSGDNSGRFVQIMRFRDRKQQLAVQNAERADPSAQALLKEFCELINLPYQQQQGLFAVGFYTSFMRMPEFRPPGSDAAAEPTPEQAGQNQPAADSSPRMRQPPKPARAKVPKWEPLMRNQRSIPTMIPIMSNPATFQPTLATKPNGRRTPPFHPVREDGINGIAKPALRALFPPSLKARYTLLPIRFAANWFA